jgi:hypothetical protein
MIQNYTKLSHLVYLKNHNLFQLKETSHFQNTSFKTKCNKSRSLLMDLSISANTKDHL